MLLCKIVNYFVSVNMLVFYDVVESKRFESIAPMVDDSVESVDVDGCLKGPILKVDVACDTSELISINETIQQQSREKPDPSTTHEQNRAKPDPTIVQEQNRVQPDPTT